MADSEHTLHAKVLTPEGQVFDGEHDDIPERAFYMQGPIEQVLEAAKTMRAEEPTEAAAAEASEQEERAEETEEAAA